MFKKQAWVKLSNISTKHYYLLDWQIFDAENMKLQLITLLQVFFLIRCRAIVQTTQGSWSDED